MNNRLKNYFHFSKAERRGVVLLCSLIVVLLVVKYFLSSFISLPLVDEKEFQKLVAQTETDSLTETSGTATVFANESETPTFKAKTETKLFYFDPNTVSASELKTLGCSDKLIKTWMNYKAKGGKFKSKEDVRKIYGVSQNFYDRIQNYIELNTLAVSTKLIVEEKHTTIEPKQINVDVNAADTMQLKALPGIGSKLAERIVAYRNRLGGFIAIQQLKEVFGIDSLLYKKIESSLSVDINRVNKLSVNYSQVSNLKQHPYFSYNVANAIVQYRERHGKYASLNDLKKVVVINESLFQKITPYLKL